MNKNIVIAVFMILGEFAFSQNYMYHKANAAYLYGYYDSVKIIAQNSVENDFVVLLGKSAYKLGKIEEAIHYFNSIKCSESYYELSKLYANKNQIDSSCKYLQLHLESKNKKMYSEIMNDTSFTSLYNSIEWKRLWKYDWYSDKELSNEKINYLIQINEFDKAKQILETQSTLSNEEMIDLAFIYIQLQDINSAKSIIKRIGFCNILNNRYICTLSSLGMFGEQYDYLNKLHYSHPEDIQINYELAKNLYNQKNYNEALKEIQRYISVYYKDSEAFYIESLCFKSKLEYTNALFSINNAIQNNPSNYKYLLERADIYMELHQYWYAELDYTQCLDLNPQIEIYFNRGDARRNLGKNREACLDYTRSVKLGNKEAVYFKNKYCK